MTLFLTRYFLRELSAWVLFVPLGSIFILFIGAFTEDPFYFTMMMVMYTCPLLFSQYFMSRKKYLTLLTIAPLPRKTIIHADLAFLSWITLCYISYALIASTLLAALIHRELLFPTIHEMSFLFGCCLFVITLYTWLARQNWIPILAFYFVILNMHLILPFYTVTPFANAYGLHFLALMLVIASLSYFTMITLEKRGLLYK